MAAGDAQAQPIKNAACRVYFPLLDADGDLVTGGAADSGDTERSIDGGTFADCSNEMTEVATASGMYYIDLNASEMNGDCICLIAKTAAAGTKTTPIVIYTGAANWHTVSDIKSELVVVSDAISDVKSELVVISDAILSDSLLFDADHDKTQSDVALLSTKLASDVLALETALDSDFLAVETKVNSDALLVMSDLSDILSDLAKTQLSDLATAAAVSDVKSELVVISDAILSDSLLYDADHDKTQSDVALLSTKQDSDMVIVAADHDKTQSDVALVDAAIDSDSVLYLADHDKTQSDVGDLSTKLASDVLALEGAFDSDFLAIETKVDSDAVLEAADHDKTQSDIALLDAAIDSDSLLYASDLSDLIAHAYGKIIKGADSNGNTTYKYYEQDDTTLRYTLTITPAERTN